MTSLFKVDQSIDKISPFFLKNDKHTFIWNNSNFNIVSNVFMSPFVSIHNNYYITDTISRMSKLLSVCSTKFKVKNYNFF